MAIERTTSRYDNDKVKVILSVPRHARDKFETMSKMYGVSMNFLFIIVCDEMYYEPLQPKLPQRVEEASNKTHAFFAKHRPSWSSIIPENNRI